MLKHLKIDNIPNSNTKEIECKLSTVISDDKLDEIKSLAEEINEMVKSGIDFNTISKEKLKFDLFDELYNNIITKEFLISSSHVVRSSIITFILFFRSLSM